ncbi:MAG: VanW family protein [Chloroflexota bacterium]|nr:VanW family protein [Chloroflexota bacterium]
MTLKNKLLVQRPALLVTGVAVSFVTLIFISASVVITSNKITPSSSMLTSTAALQSLPEPTLSIVNPVMTVVGDAFSAQVTAVASEQEQLKKLQAQFIDLTSKPFTVTYKDQTWKVAIEQLRKLIWLERGLLEIDRGGFGTLVKGWSKVVDKKPVDAVVAWSDKESKVIAQKPSQLGQKVNLEGSIDNIKAALFKGLSQAELLVETEAPRVDGEQLDKLGIKEKISEGLSGYAGSDGNRARNIVVGAQFLDDTLVPPHGVFSFNQAIGPITKERGYADGYAIVGDITEKDVGGGICQVSTTAFRAAFWAGFTINERHSHAYRVTWYESLGEPTGFDATIYQPSLDFKFTNDTDNWLLVAAYAGGARLRVVIYGTKPTWKVEMTQDSGNAINITTPPPPRYDVDPKLPVGAKQKVDSAHKGFDTFVARIVKNPEGQTVRQDKFSTHYVAWPDIYKVGPNPAPRPSSSVAPSASPGNGSPAPNKTPPAPVKPTLPPVKNNITAPTPTPPK